MSERAPGYLESPARSERMQHALFELNPQPIWVYERESSIVVTANQAAQTIYGYTLEEFCGMKVTDLLPADDVPAYLEAMQARPDSEYGRQAVPWRHRFKSGEVVEVESSHSDVVLDGRAYRIVLSQNVTERNVVAAQLVAARAAAVDASSLKSEFLANISHAIRTPMNAVVATTAMLLETPLDDNQRALADQVAKSGEQMVDLIDDILDISRIEAGELRLAVSDFDLRATIEVACIVSKLQARNKDVTLTVEVGDAVPHRARGDSRRLRQVIGNLVGNAVKFTIEGTVVVAASCSSRYEERDVVRIEVLDTGIGIEQTMIEQMLRPFTATDASTTHAYDGPGLGLAIARELTELMGGTIGAESRLGHGSRFWIDVPVIATVAPIRPQYRGVGDNEPAASQKPLARLVLVADDNPVNQALAVRMLERCGFGADVAGNGLQALTMLAKRRYDAVLMDCQMSEMDGYEATAELRRRESTGRRTPIIAFTAHTMKANREQCLQSGMDDFIGKPMRHDALVETLQRWL